MIILGIDPGNIESAYAIYDSKANSIIDSSSTNKYQEKAKHTFENEYLLNHIESFAGIDIAAIEMVESYGMAVGETVFDTCVWIGRLYETILRKKIAFKEVCLVNRGKVKMELCNTRAAKDGNITQVLLDSIGPKGSARNKGPTYGLAADTWQALAVAFAVFKQEKRKNFLLSKLI